MAVGGQHHAPAVLPPEKSPGTYCTGGWVGPRAGLDGYREEKIFCPYRGSNPVASRYTNYVITTPLYVEGKTILKRISKK